MKKIVSLILLLSISCTTTPQKKYLTEAPGMWYTGFLFSLYAPQVWIQNSNSKGIELFKLLDFCYSNLGSKGDGDVLPHLKERNVDFHFMAYYNV